MALYGYRTALPRATTVPCTNKPRLQVYLHHYFGRVDVLPGVGAESRRLPSAHPLPAPYAPIIDGARVAATPYLM